ncbi:xanthine dehydrogenase family protein molybdopterin-binding subunit [Namhaeicola litoreus]|uniref:Molybdopterin cofactor-binding domain-containing protein n=1 Tax=Namhaeicola litoreus TaxID=1052145 RepID=A0ABW3XYP8_9FLAO
MKRDLQNDIFFNDLYQAPVYDRRKFLKNLGSGIIVVFCLGDISLLNASCSNTSEDLNFNAYLRVKENGRVDCYTGKIEMGQGIVTSLAQVLAEELEVSVYDVDMVMGDTELCPYDAGTWGSLTTRFTDPVIRAAAAEAREVLLDLASEKFEISKDLLQVNNGAIYVKNDPSKKISYAELTKGQKIVKNLKEKPQIKKAKDFKIIGKPILSMDAEAKVTGKAKYTADIKLPGMVYAKIVRPDIFGSEKVSVDTSGLSDFEDIEFVETDDFVAVVHKDPEVANKAMNSIRVIWKSPELKVDQESIFNYLEEQIKESKVFEEAGSLKVGKAKSKIYLEGKYLDGYKAHACMETHAATCYFEGDKLTMWVSTQTPFGTRSQVAKELNMPEEKVHVKQVFLGGGFGGKGFNSQAIEAALIAKKVGKPVQLSFSRKEEFFYNRFRTAAVVNVGAGVDEKGELTVWDFDIYCAGTRGTNLFYDIPDNRTRMFNKSGVHPFGTGAWRAPGNNTTTFARESHIDVLANAAGIDPYDFRIRNLKDQNMVATLKLAAETFGWGKEKKSNRGFGIALGQDAGTLVAMISEVEVNKQTGEVKVIRVICAQDMGQVVNPHGATIQTEGGITMGVGYALFEEIEFEGGKMKTDNFNNYEFTRFSKTPEINCVFIDKMDAKPQGGGEPAIICVGASIANAVFDACGARVNRLPITPQRVLSGMS